MRTSRRSRCLTGTLVLLGCVACERLKPTDSGDTPGLDTVDSIADSVDSVDSIGETQPIETGDTGVHPDDLDGDGWVTPDDCDDTDPTVNPGATEICGDDVDEDCDGAADTCRYEGEIPLAGAELLLHGLPDTGVLSVSYRVGDLDGDGLADVMAGAPEHQRLEDDRIGTAYLFTDLAGRSGAYDPGIATASFFSSDGGGVGGGVAGLGDTNRDGHLDLVFPGCDGTPGRVCVAYGPFSGEYDLAVSSDAMIWPDLDSAGDSLMQAAPASGDIDGDGASDLALGSCNANWNAGLAYLFTGPLEGNLSHDDARTAIYGSQAGSAGEWLGTNIDLADVDGDGVLDVLVGATDHDETRDCQGASYVILAPPTGALVADDDADVALYGENSRDYAGFLTGPGDLDGDGYEDIWIAAPFSDTMASYGGSAYLIQGGPGLADTRGTVTDHAYASFHGEQEEDTLSISWPVGDVDGDGQTDAVLSANAYRREGHGHAYLLYGPISPGARAGVEPDATFIGEDPGDEAGGTLSPGDLDGDGTDDLIIIARGWDMFGTDVGANYVFFGGAP